MSTDLFGRVLFSDGEEIDPGDLTGIGSRVLAILWDQIFAAMPANLGLSEPSFNEIYDPTTSPFAFSITAMGGRPVQGSANNKVKISVGTLLQAVAAPDGNEPQLLAFKFDGTTEFTIANGDPSNPRVDIVQMKLAYVNDTPTARDFEDAITRAKSTTTPNIRRRVSCTLSVKQGAPAASPTYPVADAGFVVVAGIVVGTSYAGAAPLATEDAAGAVAVLHDQRMPIGIRAHCLTAKDLMFDASVWVPIVGSGDWLIAAAGANVAPVTAVCRNVAQGRLLSIAQFANTKTTGLPSGAALSEASVVKYQIIDNAGTVGFGGVTLATANGLTGGTAGNSYRAQLASSMIHNPGAGPVVQPSAAGVSPPIWTSGRRAPATTLFGAFPRPFETLAYLCRASENSSGAGTIVGPAAFWIAGGL